MKSKRVFIVVSHMSTMNREGESERLEKCEFVDSLKKRHYVESSYILDYLKEVVVKDRYSADYEKHIRYITKTYPEQTGSLNEEYKNGKSDIN